MMAMIRVQTLALSVLCTCSMTALAQNPAPAPFKEGEKIEYRAQRYPEKWQEGVFVKVTYNGDQYLIRETPTQFFPEGFEKAYAIADVRPLPAPAANPATAPDAGGGAPVVPVPDAVPAAGAPAADPMPAPNAAPAGPFQPQENQPLEYLDRSVFPHVWRPGTAVRKMYGSEQWLIRQAPSQFFPDGFERTYSLEDLRAPQPKAQHDLLEAAACGDEAIDDAQPAPSGSSPMSQDEVLAFLRSRFGAGDPFANPRKDQILDQLRGEVLRRGLSFRYETLGTFSNELGTFGAISNVRSAMAENFGAPAKRGDLYGTWELAKVGGNVPYEKNNRLYARSEYFAIAGKLVINPDNTYAWGTATEPLAGKWRAATAEEMAKSDKGGEGIVLLRAKSGADWLVFKRDEGTPQGLGIKIVDLETRNLRERGTRP